MSLDSGRVRSCSFSPPLAPLGLHPSSLRVQREPKNFVTAGSVQKTRYLTERVRIPSTHVISSRDSTDLKRMIRARQNFRYVYYISFTDYAAFIAISQGGNKAPTPSRPCVTLSNISPLWGRPERCDVRHTSRIGVILQRHLLRRCPHHTSTTDYDC